MAPIGLMDGIILSLRNVSAGRARICNETIKWHPDRRHAHGLWFSIIVPHTVADVPAPQFIWSRALVNRSHVWSRVAPILVVEMLVLEEVDALTVRDTWISELTSRARSEAWVLIIWHAVANIGAPVVASSAVSSVRAAAPVSAEASSPASTRST